MESLRHPARIRKFFLFPAPSGFSGAAGGKSHRRAASVAAGCLSWTTLTNETCHGPENVSVAEKKSATLLQPAESKKDLEKSSDFYQRI